MKLRKSIVLLMSLFMMLMATNLAIAQYSKDHDKTVYELFQFALYAGTYADYVSTSVLLDRGYHDFNPFAEAIYQDPFIGAGITTFNIGLLHFLTEELYDVCYRHDCTWFAYSVIIILDILKYYAIVHNFGGF